MCASVVPVLIRLQVCMYSYHIGMTFAAHCEKLCWLSCARTSDPKTLPDTASKSSGEANSTTFPASSTKIKSLSIIVSMRCAIVKRVAPWNDFRMTSWICSPYRFSYTNSVCIGFTTGLKISWKLSGQILGFVLPIVFPISTQFV